MHTKGPKDKQMEHIFHSMHKATEDSIEEHDFIDFLTTSHEAHSENSDLQRLLLTEINDLLHGKRQSSMAYTYHSSLIESDFFEFSYIPSTSHTETCTKYELQIARLKDQLNEVIATLRQTVDSNAQHIGEHQQVIAQLKYSLLKQQEEEEAQEILIQSSLEPTTDYNPLEWGVDDVADWLKMVKLSHYTHAFKVYQINGHKLLNEVCHWTQQQFLDELNFECVEDVDLFLHKVSILQQTAPQIYDPHKVEPSPCPSTPSALSVYSPREYRRSDSIKEAVHEEAEQEEDEEEDEEDELIVIGSPYLQLEENAIVPLQEADSVTLHTFVPPQSVQQQLGALKEQQSEEIARLKVRVERIEKSKAESLVAASLEIDRLRNMIKMFRVNYVKT